MLVRTTPVCIFCAVTCTFGMRAPVGSRTVPDNVAFVLCAEVDTATNRNRTPHDLFISCSSTDAADSIKRKRKLLSLLKPGRPSTLCSPANNPYSPSFHDRFRPLHSTLHHLQLNVH